ncbi:MAG: CopD family protein [Deltaproteobacteria bacterium]|nr:CopD family protein [Deltaproteobacteria bacterium]
MERPILVFLHVLGATVWVGGHLVLALSVLPRALREESPRRIQEYEEAFERIGLPALAVQVLTGLRLAWIYAPPSAWLGFDGHVPRHVTLKLITLAGTIALAVHARLSLVPKLSTADGARALRPLGWHIVAITILAVFFAFVGVSLRGGGLL